MAVLKRFLVASVAYTCVGCGPAPGDSLIDPAAWTFDLAVDPQPEHAPEVADCPPYGWILEEGGIDMDLGICPYFVLTQPSLITVGEGQPLWIASTHDILVFDRPSTGHLLLTIDGEILVDREVSIPANSAILDVEVAAPRRLRAGSPVVLHLHNHGPNTWTLGGVTVGPGAP